MGEWGEHSHFEEAAKDSAEASMLQQKTCWVTCGNMTRTGFVDGFCL